MIIQNSRQIDLTKDNYFLSDGSVPMIDVLAKICNEIKPYKLYLTSFQSSSEDARRIDTLRKKYNIEDIAIFFDKGLKLRKPDTYKAVHEHLGDCTYLISNHSKLIIAESESRKVMVSSSANFNKAIRLEFFCVFTDFDQSLFDDLDKFKLDNHKDAVMKISHGKNKQSYGKWRVL